MWHRESPTISTETSLRTCADATRNPDLRKRYRAGESDIVKAVSRYQKASGGQKLHTLKSTSFGVTGVTKKEMMDLYDLRMVDTDAGRAIYEDIMTQPGNERCPLCNFRDARTMDHHLPKSVFSALTVEPSNLIPVCGICNQLKGDTAPSTPEDEPIHPYYEDYDDTPWLTAKILPVSPTVVLFEVQAPTYWDAVMVARVKRHFRQYQLLTLYALQANNAINNMRGALRRIYDAQPPGAGPAAVQFRLADDALSARQHQVNSWETATLTALASNQWFYSGGFDS